MLWQRTKSTDDNPSWVALDARGKRAKNGEGKHFIRYCAREGAAIFEMAGVPGMDKSHAPEALPPGVPADSPEGIRFRFITDEAVRDWRWLDAESRATLRAKHIACNDETSWPVVSAEVPLRCEVCGVLKGDEPLYVEVLNKVGERIDGNTVRAIAYDYWIRGVYQAEIAKIEGNLSTASSTSSTTDIINSRNGAHDSVSASASNPKLGFALVLIAVLVALVIGLLAQQP